MGDCQEQAKAVSGAGDRRSGLAWAEAQVFHLSSLAARPLLICTPLDDRKRLEVLVGEEAEVTWALPWGMRCGELAHGVLKALDRDHDQKRR